MTRHPPPPNRSGRLLCATVFGPSQKLFICLIWLTFWLSLSAFVILMRSDRYSTTNGATWRPAFYGPISPRRTTTRRSPVELLIACWGQTRLLRMNSDWTCSVSAVSLCVGQHNRHQIEHVALALPIESILRFVLLSIFSQLLPLNF